MFANPENTRSLGVHNNKMFSVSSWIDIFEKVSLNGLYADTIINKMSSRTAGQCAYNVSSLLKEIVHTCCSNKEGQTVVEIPPKRNTDLDRADSRKMFN